FRRRPSNSGRVTNRQPPPTASSRIPRPSVFVRSAIARSASSIAARSSPSISTKLSTGTGLPDEKRSASSAGWIRATRSVMVNVLDFRGIERPLGARNVDLGERARLEDAEHRDPGELERGEERRDRLRAVPERPEELEERERPALLDP